MLLSCALFSSIEQNMMIKIQNQKGTVERYFCRQCGSPIYAKSPKNKPEKMIIKLSLFVGQIKQLPRPMKDLFCN